MNLLTNTFRRFQFKKLRLLLAWIGGAFLVLNSNFSDDSFRLGLPLVLAGEFIRIITSGYLERKGSRLATSGPFAYVRNPLYIGNFFLGLGVVVMSWNSINLLLFFAGFYFVYRGTVLKEEKVLTETFGAAYQNYLDEVPRFFPRWYPYSRSNRDAFNWKLLLKHREYITFAGIVILISSFYVLEEIHEDGGLKHFLRLKIAALLIGAAILILIFEWVRKTIQN